MMESNGSRRAFVGTAIVGAALAGPVAFLLRGSHGAAAGGGSAITVVPGRAAVAPTASQTLPAGEIAEAAQAIGQTFAVSATEGTAAGELAAIVPIVAEGTRPATVRAVPFAAVFTFPLGGAPLGNRIYRISQPIAGLTELFMTRGDDRAGRAVLTAIFG